MLGLAVGGFVLSNAFRNAVAGQFRQHARDRYGRIDRRRRARSAGRRGRCRTVSSTANSTASIPAFITRSVRSGAGARRADIALAVRSSLDHHAGQHARRASPTAIAMGPENQHLRVLSRRVEFPAADTPQPNDTHAYIFSVAGDLSEVEAEISAFNGTLIWSFAASRPGPDGRDLPAGARRPAAACAGSGMRWPASATASAQRLEGRFPRRDRAAGRRTQFPDRAQRRSGGAAPAPMSPTWRISSRRRSACWRAKREAAARPLVGSGAAGRWRRCAGRWIIIWRARAPPAASMCWATAPRSRRCLNDLARVLARIHAERGIVIDCDCPPDLFFRGERQDLEEMAGNLMDNACKWARSPGAGARRSRRRRSSR